MNGAGLRAAASLALWIAGASGAHAQTTAASGSAAASDLAEARRLINEGEPRRALEILRTSGAAHEPARQTRIALLTGVASYHAGEPAKAIDALASIVDWLEPESIERREAEQILGLSFFLVGRFADAVPRLEATRRWAGDNLELAYALGQAYIQTQRPDDARLVLASMYHVAPESAAAHLVTAQMMVRLELESLAEAELAKALSKDPRLPNASFLLGQIALFRGRLEDAVTLTERELAVNPVSALALSQLGDAYLRQAKWDDAIAALQKSIWLNPYYSAPYILLGRAYLKKEQPSTAEGMLRRAIQYDPNNRTAHYLLAQLLQQTGRVDEAKREFEIAERLSGTRGR
jgi:tetratricopeptide (TPR) repeat protein